MDDIDARRPDPLPELELRVTKAPVPVICPDHLRRQLRAYEESLSKSTGSLPYRHQIQLNAIAESLVVLRRGRELTQGDIDTVARLSKWINYDFKEI